MLAKSVALPSHRVPEPEPGKSSNLKRTASVASLPTPPRTQRKRRPAKGKASALSDSDGAGGSDTVTEDELPVGGKQNRHKKRRLSRVQEGDEDDQDGFWLDTAPAKSLPSKSSSWDSSEEEVSGEEGQVPLLLRRKAHSDAASDYASPPPSHRKAKANNGVSIKTPHSKSAIPIRDSPNNPFLDSPPQSQSSASQDEDDDAQVSYDVGEKPTVTYVHRGVRREFPNPYYDPATGRARPPNPNSLLPPEHEDYEPDLRCGAKVLFPGPGKQRRGKHAKKRAESQKTWRSALRRTPDGPDSDEQGSEPAASSLNPLLMAPGPPRRRRDDDSW